MIKISNNMAYTKFDKNTTSVIVMHLYILICKNMLVNTSDFWFQYNDSLNSFITILFVFIYLKLVIFDSLLSKIKIDTLAAVALIIIFILITYCFDSNRFIADIFPYMYVKRQIRTFLAYCLPLFLTVSSLDDIEVLLKKLYDFTLIPFIFATVSFVLSLQPHVNGVYMSYGNAVLFLSLILLFKVIHTNSLIHYLQFGLTCIYIFISGSRGPLVSIAIAVVLALFFIMKDKNPILVVFCAIVMLLIILLYKEILGIVIETIEKFGINSRTVNMLLDGKIFTDSDRSIIHQQLKEKIFEYPIIGFGAFGGEATVGLSHSLYLDIFANFGLIIGGLFIAYIVFKDLFLIFTNKYSAVSELLLIASIYLFPRGFFDENFWGSKELWIILALFIQIGSNPVGVFKYSQKKLRFIQRIANEFSFYSNRE